MSDSKIKFNKIKNKVVLACLIIQEMIRILFSVRTGRPFTLIVRRALIYHLKDFHTGVLLSLYRRLIHSRIYFGEIIKKFITINCQEESSRFVASNIGRLFAFKWRYWSRLYLGQWIWNSLQGMGFLPENLNLFTSVPGLSGISEPQHEPLKRNHWKKIFRRMKLQMLKRGRNVSKILISWNIR